METEEFLKLCRMKNDTGYDKINDFIKNKGVFKSIKGASDTTPLHLAARAGNKKIVQLLIDNDMNPMVRDKTKLGKTPIVDAIDKGFIDIALIMLNSKIIKPLKTKKRYSETTALSRNTTIPLKDYEYIVNKLNVLGFDLNMLDAFSSTLLHDAIKSDDKDKIDICLKNGCNINNPERLPLKFALYLDKTHNDLIKYLLEKGASIEIKTEESWSGFNALHTAHYKDNLEIFVHLIKNYNALATIGADTLNEIISFKEIEFLKHLWEIPQVHDFILKNNLEEAFPDTVKDIFIF